MNTDTGLNLEIETIWNDELMIVLKKDGEMVGPPFNPKDSPLTENLFKKEIMDFERNRKINFLIKD